MLFKVLILVAATFAVVNSDCVSCICQHESGCKPIGCRMDVGSLSCGYFQIKLPYYEDCGQPSKRPGESTEAAWKRCADDYNCAVTCLNAYIRRYASKCTGVGACQQMSRLHNGGPNGCHNSGTVGYWNVIHGCCGCS
uniref:Lysozyme n=1 Tax=Panagrolaimus sp. PS1159 TaxID=55785 RepID=A0AC35GVV5_9BILA